MATPHVRSQAGPPVGLDALRRALGDPGTFPHPAYDLELRETHLSLVALAGPWVWKIKKAVDLGFVDFSDLEARRLACREEVRLNRRLAPEVYVDVRPLVRTAEGELRLDGAGDVVEWAVKMRRLADEHRLSDRLDTVSRSTMARLGRHVAEFHRRAARDPHIASFGAWEAVAALARENFDETRGHVGQVVHAQVWSRVRKRTDMLLALLKPLIERRAALGVPCETHGDLRLEHVYLTPPGSFTVLDGIEFSERYRHADPVADVAFLAMELGLRGREDLARTFVDAWVERSKDPEARELLPLYVGYRAVVRAKVAGIGALDATRDAETRTQLRHLAQRHWLYALGQLAEPRRRPALLLVGGLPGVGKTWLAKEVAAAEDFDVLRSDVVRKSLAGRDPLDDAAADFGQGLYTPEWTERTYRALLDDTRRRLQRGERVIVDASFGSDAWRAIFLTLARDLSVPAWFVHVTAEAGLVEDRLRRRVGDASDASVDVYRRARDRWERDSDAVAQRAVLVDGGDVGAGARDAVVALLARHGLSRRGVVRGAGRPW